MYLNLRKTIVLCAVAITAISSCRKEKNTAPDEEECMIQNNGSGNNIIAGQYIITYKASDATARLASPEQLEEKASVILTRHQIDPSTISNNFGGEPGGFVAKLSNSQVNLLQSDPAIAHIEQDRLVKLSTCFTVAEPRLITWNIHRVGYGDGTGKTAWIIDTGIDFEHPDLNVDVTRSRSFLLNDASADDKNGHGTHVAGIIGGKNNTFGVLGVASGAKLVSLRVLDASGEGPLSGIIQALAYINANAAAGDVVNMSLGEDATSTTLNNQVVNTSSRGIFISIAAGNDNQLANKFSPGNANGPNIFTISAIDSLDKFASFSNYGNDVVDYAAPGVRILSTYLDGRYAYMSGTSMAAPHMAGLLLLKGKRFTTSGTALNDPDGNPDPIAHY